MIDIIHASVEEFNAAQKLEFGAGVLKGRQDLVLGLVILKCGGRSYPVRVVEVRYTKYGRLCSEDKALMALPYDYSTDTVITYYFWRQP